MYCPKCGNQEDDNKKFCSSCGASLQGTALENGPKNSKMHTYSQILLWATAPLVLLLRMMFQEQGIGYSWRQYTYYYLPSGMKVALMVLSVFMLGTSLYLESKNQASKIALTALTAVECIIALAICFVIVMVQS